MFPNDLWIADPHANKLYKVVNDIVQPTVLNTSNNPRSILVSQDMTSVYAVNRDSNSITQYRSGTEIRTIGVGKMPYGICEDSNHNVYVTNYQDNTVTKISGSKVVATIAVDAGPRGITCDENDDIYVACFLASTVVKISSGVNVASIKVGQNPEGITCDSSDNIWVACYGSNIATKITKGIKVLDIEVGKGPVAIVVDNKGVVYTANYYSNDVTMIATNSDATMSITNIPVGDGPTAIAVNRDNEVYVTSGLGTDVRKIVDGVVTDTIEVCDNPSAFGDFTGCSAYNVFNQVPAGGTTVGVPEGGWKLTDLESGVQDALNKVIGGISPSTASNVTYEKTTMVDDEEEILNITVESALNELYDTVANQNDPKQIIVDKESGTTLETKLSQIDTAVNNCPTDAEFTSLKTLVNNAATQSQLNDVATIANNAATKEQLYQVSAVANAAAKKTELADAVNRITSIEQTYNKPSAITIASGDDGPVTLDQKLASIDADIATRATTVALNAVKTVADAAAPQTALDAVSTRLTTVEEKYNKPENIVVGSVSTPGASPEDPPTVSNVTLNTKLTEIDATTSDLDTRLEEVEENYNKPEKIIVGQKDAEEEESEPIDVTLADKLKEIDDTLATKADNAGTTETINGINERVQAIEEVYNKPDHIIVEYTGEEQDTPVTLVDKFISVAEQFTADEAKIEDHETRVAVIEAVYNKPEKIIVGQKDAEEGEPDPVDVTLADKLTEIDSKFTTQDEEDTAMDVRVKAIEAVYNKPDHIIVGQVPSEEEPETAVDVTLSTKLGEIDTEVEEVKALAEAAATQTDFDELSQEVSENETTLTQLKSDYDATKSVVDGLETDMTTVQTNMNQPSKIVVGQTEDDDPADITLDNKLASMDKAIAAKAEQTALEEVKTTADAAAPQTALDAVDTRVETLETNINNPDLIIVNPDPETNLTTKLADIDSKFSTQEETNTSVDGRISAIEAAYNKPEKIIVGQKESEEGEPDPIDVTLDVKLGEIDDALGLKLEAGAISDMLTKTEASSTYATKTAIADMATNASVDGKLSAYTNTEGMNAALALKADKATVESTYATKQELTTATTDMATNAGVDAKLEPYAKTSDVDSKITAAVSGLQWKTSVADITALKAITTPSEGWTVSVNDTNSVYRFDAQSEEEDDGDKFIKADDDTAGAWVKLSTAFYSVATGSADGLMSAADKTKLDGITISDYLKVSEAASTYATQTAIADMATNASVDTKLEGYVPVADISDMLTKTEATSTYATKVELGNKADSSAIADMATNAKVAETYATKESLADYATTEAMNAALGNKADTTALSAYATTESVKSTYATKAELGNKADTSAIADMATNTEVAETYATKDELSGKADTSALAGYVQTSAIADMATNAKVAETYATKTELSAKADSSALANYVQTSAIEDMATNTDVEATYATKAALTEGLAGKADTNALSKYATTESLANYVQASAIADMATNAGVAGTYATKESLADYATTEAMNAALGNKADSSAIADMATNTEVAETYATKESLADYATTESLAGYVQTSAISDMATNTNVAATYATKAELGNKADTSELSKYATTESLAEYATKAELGNKADTSAIANMNNPDNIMISEQTLTATIASLQSTIASLTSRIEKLESPQG